LLISDSAFLQISAPFARPFLFITIHNITALISNSFVFRTFCIYVDPFCIAKTEKQEKYKLIENGKQKCIYIFDVARQSRLRVGGRKGSDALRMC